VVQLGVIFSAWAEFRVRIPYFFDLQLVIDNAFKESGGLGFFLEFT